MQIFFLQNSVNLQYIHTYTVALFPKFFSCLASQIIHIRQQANITLIHGGRKVHIDDLQRKHNFKIIRYFFNTSKCATNHVISLEGYDGFIGQKYLMLWRQESWPFGPGWSAYIMRIRSWTFRLPWWHLQKAYFLIEIEC